MKAMGKIKGQNLLVCPEEKFLIVQSQHGKIISIERVELCFVKV
jgi:hypothetical protein